MNVFTANESKIIILGRQHENEVVTIQFPIKKWIEFYGDGTFFLRNRRSKDELAYECVIEQTEEYVLWTLTNTDLVYEGYGEAQLTMFVGDKVAKSEIFTTYVGKSLEETEEPPEPWESWVERVETAAMNAATETAEEIREEMQGYAESAENAKSAAETAQEYAEAAKNLAESAAATLTRIPEENIDLLFGGNT